MRNAHVALLTLLLATASGCYYDNEAVLYGAQECVPDAPTYSTTIAPLIGRNCLSCHGQASSNGGIALETYTQVIAQVESGRLMGAITHSNGFSPMPKNSRQLSECDINAIRTWIDAGAPEN
jgi:mono/diheme cytochrome c family protein